MNATTRVDLHCHSTFSDGVLAPDDLVEQLAAAGVAFAALTDHDTIDGVAAFREAAARRGLGFVAGLELTVQCGPDREAHLLAYGIDPTHLELNATLRSIRQARNHGIHGITQSMRAIGADATAEGSAHSRAVNGRLDITDGIDLIHRAGGLAVLAHPLLLEPDIETLRSLLRRLKARGLDGVEALYGRFDAPQRERLCELARTEGLLVAAGSDAHTAPGGNEPGLGLDMPTPLWRQFRDALHRAGSADAPAGPAAATHRPRWAKKHFIFHIIFPTVLALGLFVGAIFGVLLPAFERTLLDRKREMIRELTNSAYSILVEAEREERDGRLSRPRAQDLAKERIGALRYGREGKDYFWLQDAADPPRMVMHPYRADLNGQDVSEFRDARGVRIFVEFRDLVARQKEGYIEYVWQWKDDPQRLVPKESYIKGFQPWGWIIGTGLYIEDVQQEIARLERNLIWISLVISVVIALLLVYVMRESLHLERGRSAAERFLLESTERYRSLVEATTEGTLLVVDGRCRYANPVLLAMLGRSANELELLDLQDVVPLEAGNRAAWDHIARLGRNEEPTGGFEGALRRRDGMLVECALAVSRISFADKSGFILLAHEVRPQRVGDTASDGSNPRDLAAALEAVDAAPIAVIRARAARRGLILRANRLAGQLVGTLTPATGGGEPAALADLFADDAAFGEFLQDLCRDGQADRQLHLTGGDARTRAVLLRGSLARGEDGSPRFIDAIIQDVTAATQREADREALVGRLQTSLLFLHAPLRELKSRVLFCRTDTPVRKAAELMSSHRASAVLVQTEAGETVGIVTDHDLRERVLAAGLAGSEPAHRVMSAPLVIAPERAQIYEALLLMQERNVQHLAVADDDGRIVGLVQGKELLQFPGYGAIVLTREVARAGAPDEVTRCCRRVPGLVKALLDSGAHPRNMTRMIASVCDAATERFVELATAEMGPAPAPFAFLAMGSQGRQEQTLFTDQDNAILYADIDGAAAEDAQAYFRQLAERVCRQLDQAGYPFCRGEVMARNPRWVQPLAVWKQYFDAWIAKAEPTELLEFSIFFDFRAVCGAAQLARDLRGHVHQTLSGCPAFFPHFAQNALLFKPPMRLFGRILGSGEHPGLDLKDAMMPIVNFARLYALRQGLGQTHTLDRLDALAERDVLLPASRDETAAAYDFLMRLRLRHQSAAIEAGEPLDNVVNHRKLGHMEEAQLRLAFAQIDAVQKRIRLEFLAGT